MKSLHFALVCSLLLALAGSLPAEARPGGYSGTSAFRGGFSSQRAAPARSLAASRAVPQHSGPGSFGGAAGTAAPARSGSAMSRDLEQSTAQANALKTLDARRAAAAPPPVPPVPPVAAASVRPQPVPGMVYTMPQPVMVQRHNGFMYGLMGFMLGRSLSTPQPVYYPPDNGNNNGGNGNNGGNNGGSAQDNADWSWNDPNHIGMSGGYASTAAGVVAAAPQPQPSFGASVLRVLAWLMLPILLACLVHAIARRMRRGRTAGPNYSFERK